MSDTADLNATSFERYFVSGRMEFADWIETFLQTGVAAPFSFPTRIGYDLGDLLEDLLRRCRGKDEWVLFIENALKKVLLRIPHNFNFDKLSAIADAVARAGFRAIAGELAVTVAAVAENATLSPVATEDDLGSLIRTLDKTVASISKFALDKVEEDSPVLRACAQLFNIDELSLFSSSLFAPLALSHIKEWPELWAALETKAQKRIDAWGIDPSISNFKSIVSTSNGLEIATYFDLGHVMRDFIAQAISKGIRLTTLIAIAQQAESDAARVAVQELFQYSPRKCISITHIFAGSEQLYIWLEPDFIKSYHVKKHREKIENVQNLPLLAEIDNGRYKSIVDALGKVPVHRRSDVWKTHLVSNLHNAEVRI